VVEDILVSVHGELHARLSKALSLASEYHSLISSFSDPSIGPMLSAYFLACSSEFVKDDAIERARAHYADLVIDPVALERDTVELLSSCEGSIESLARRRMLASAPDRFNRKRALSFAHTDDFGRLMMLVEEEGASILVPPDFVNQPPPVAFRPLHIALGNTVMAHALKLWNDGKILLLQEDRIPCAERSLMNFVQSHWTGDKNKDGGRWLADVTAGASPDAPVLNSDEAFAMAEAKYGPSFHPTMMEIIRMWYARADQDGKRLSEYRLWLIDIVSAFSQFSFRPDHVHRVCMRVAINLVAVFLVGFFGLSYCPLIYAIFSRALNQAICLAILGVVATYCDDTIGFSPAAANSDFELAQAICRKMFGPSAVSIPKLVYPTTVAVVLGWKVDLVSELLLPSDRGIRKLAFVFFVVVDTELVSWPLQLCQVLASLAQRYRFGVRGTDAFVAPFNKLLTGNQSRFCKRRVSSAARFCVEMWRVAIMRLIVDPLHMAVPMRSLLRQQVDIPTFRLITDAGPDGVGAVVKNANGDILCFANLHFPNRLGSKFQNSGEYCGFIFSLVLLIEVIGPSIKGSSVQWTTDNAAALSWIDANRCSSLFAQQAFMALSAIVTEYDLQIWDSIKIPGDEMCDVDRLSRFLSTPSLPPEFQYDAESNLSIRRLFEAIDPTKDYKDCADHHRAYRLVHQCVSALGLGAL
jgi:hypothetical protein